MVASMGHMSGFAEPGTLVLPLWSAAVLGAIFVTFCVFVLGRAGRDGILEAVLRVGLLLAGAAVASAVVWVVVLDATSAGTFATQRRALDARLLEMTTRAVVPGSALACLDGAAGDMVEAACEKALFATPEAAAASVTYVTAQLSLLADGSEFERRSGANYEPALGGLRHALETDRFGIVAHVLADRDGCTEDRCDTFRLLRDTGRVSENLSAHKYESYVLHHATDWLQSALTSMAAETPAPTSAPASAPARGPLPNAAPLASAAPPLTSKAAPNGLYFPSSASIPAVSIMNAEPAPPQAAAPADGSTGTAKPPAAVARKPAAATPQGRRPMNLASPAPPAAAAPAPGQVGDQ
jgi:hypothetical protein